MLGEPKWPGGRHAQYQSIYKIKVYPLDCVKKTVAGISAERNFTAGIFAAVNCTARVFAERDFRRTEMSLKGITAGNSFRSKEFLANGYFAEL